MIYYGGSDYPIHIDDRILAHLKVVITTKLRRGESLVVSWPHPEDQPPGRSAIWLNPAVPLRFESDALEQPELSRQLLSDLANAANSSGGIQLTAEDVARWAYSSPPRKQESLSMV